MKYTHRIQSVNNPKTINEGTIQKYKERLGCSVKYVT